MKLLTLILMTLFFFVGCENINTEDESDAVNVDEVTIGEEEEMQRVEPNNNDASSELSSTFITCTGNNTTYEIIRSINSSCDVCCELYITESGESPVLISVPELLVSQCDTLKATLIGGGRLSYLAEEHKDKVDSHNGMSCAETT